MDNTRIYVVPGWFDKEKTKRLLVRNPSDIKNVVPDVGMLVPIIGSAGRYWRKKLKTGEVIKTNPPQIEAKTKQRKKEDK